MAKRYHESERAVQVKKVYGKGMASDKRHADEKVMNRDSHMIEEDWSAPCLLPKMVIDRDWPRSHNYMNYSEADLFMGVNKQLNEDQNDMKKAFKAGKY